MQPCTKKSRGYCDTVCVINQWSDSESDSINALKSRTLSPALCPECPLSYRTDAVPGDGVLCLKIASQDVRLRRVDVLFCGIYVYFCVPLTKICLPQPLYAILGAN